MLVRIINNNVDQYPYTINNLHKSNKNTSFPKTLDESTLNEYNVYTVLETQKPSFDSKKQKVIEKTPKMINGVWTQVWEVVNLTNEEINKRFSVYEKNIRSSRNSLLKETDWVIIKYTELGTNIPTEWKTYRQALRDITEHANFPFLNEEDWPTKPVV